MYAETLDTTLGRTHFNDRQGLNEPGGKLNRPPLSRKRAFLTKGQRITTVYSKTVKMTWSRFKEQIPTVLEHFVDRLIYTKCMPIELKMPTWTN